LGAKVFFIWGSTCLAGFFYVYLVVPETKGLSLEEIDTMMKETNPRNSASWKTGRRLDDNRSEGVVERKDSNRSGGSFRRWFSRKRSVDKTEVEEVEPRRSSLSTPELQV
jgi:hypothetical protein